MTSDAYKREKDDLANQLSLSSMDIQRLKARLEDKDKELEELSNKIKELRRSSSQVSEFEVVIEEHKSRIDKLTKERDSWKDKAMAAMTDTTSSSDLDQLKERLRLANLKISELEERAQV